MHPATERAALLLGLGRIDDARSVLERHLASQPDDAVGWAYLSNSLLNHDSARAVDAALRAVALEPGSSWIHLKLSIAFGWAGESDLAIEAAETAISLSPHEPECYRILAGELLLSAERKEEALPQAQRATELAPGDPLSWTTLADAYLVRGEYGKANDAYRKALEIDPGCETAMLRLARSRAFSGDAVGALDLSHRMLRVNPTSADARGALDEFVTTLLDGATLLAFPITVALYFAVRAIWGK